MPARAHDELIARIFDRRGIALVTDVRREEPRSPGTKSSSSDVINGERMRRSGFCASATISVFLNKDRGRRLMREREMHRTRSSLGRPPGVT